MKRWLTIFRQTRCPYNTIDWYRLIHFYDSDIIIESVTMEIFVNNCRFNTSNYSVAAYRRAIAIH